VSQNLVSLLITKDQQSALMALLVQFLQILQGLIDLEPEQRARLITKGAGSDRFVRIVILALQQNPDIVPRNLDVAEAQADLDALEMLEPIVTMLRQVLSRVEDTQMALGSDLMVFANKGYALMQANGSAAGLEDALNEASYRYAKKRRKPKAENDDNNSK